MSPPQAGHGTFPAVGKFRVGPNSGGVLIHISMICAVDWEPGHDWEYFERASRE